MAYSPLGRGFLTGTIRSVQDLKEKDRRIERFPRFQGDNLEKVKHSEYLVLTAVMKMFVDTMAWV